VHVLSENFQIIGTHMQLQVQQNESECLYKVGQQTYPADRSFSFDSNYF